MPLPLVRCDRFKDDTLLPGEAFGIAASRKPRQGRAQHLAYLLAGMRIPRPEAFPGAAKGSSSCSPTRCPTGHHATELATCRPGESVAIYGADTIGLLTAYCALRLRGAAVVYVVDRVLERLEKAGELGVVPIDYTAADPVEQIAEEPRLRRRRGSSWRGEEAIR
jgi:hypothetical protein